jgi:hypothetical protein
MAVERSDTAKIIPALEREFKGLDLGEVLKKTPFDLDSIALVPDGLLEKLLPDKLLEIAKDLGINIRDVLTVAIDKFVKTEE